MRFVVLLVLTGVTVIGLRTFVIASYYIPSASMEHTLHGCPGCQPDLVLVDKLSYRFKSIAPHGRGGLRPAAAGTAGGQAADQAGDRAARRHGQRPRRSRVRRQQGSWSSPT